MIKDYDIFYFDDADLSWEAEDAVIRRANGLCADLNVVTEIKNQARVHLWYERRFARPYPKLAAATGGIDHYLISGTCLGIDVATGSLYAPNGLEDAWRGILRMNPRNPNPDLFLEKAESFKRRWNWLTIEAL